MPTCARKYVMYVLCWVALMFSCPAWGKGPIALSKLDGLADDALFKKVYLLIQNHQQLTYRDAWAYNSRVGVDEQGNIIDMYSDCTLSADEHCGNENYNTGTPCQCYNREHALPKSWWGGSELSAMYTDIVHLLPIDAVTNEQRSYYPYGEPTSNIVWSNQVGAKLGNSSAYGANAYVFYPNPTYRGDIARIYFYMITCYHAVNCAQNKQAQRVIEYTNGRSFFKTAFLNVLLKWHREDPVLDYERTRNNQIEAVQYNRNPFVDYPELVEYIWGNRKGQTFTASTALPAVSTAPKAHKTLRNGHLFIETNNRIYTILGQTIN